MDRRTFMAASPAVIGLVGTAAPTAARAFDSSFGPADTTAWDRALATYRRAEARYEQLCDECAAADQAVAHATPARVDRYFEEYGLGIGMTRAQIAFYLAHYNLRAKVKIDQNATLEEFEAYQNQTLAARKRFRTFEFDAARRAYYPTYVQAQNDLMKVPAPTNAALLMKVEIATTSQDEDHAESMLADARRLLGDA
ncbi:hypothetical protein [Altericroceibacterium xinjiangense]|uniref:hypothetical protein n=1 Tax=Altericroceibacterium xinjiangense TaxID=762261 RepID=UPI000F7F136D|nr:hypothetical protein [Altericroceibacterium xinjiangense]